MLCIDISAAKKIIKRSNNIDKALSTLHTCKLFVEAVLRIALSGKNEGNEWA